MDAVVIYCVHSYNEEIQMFDICSMFVLILIGIVVSAAVIISYLSRRISEGVVRDVDIEQLKTALIYNVQVRGWNPGKGFEGETLTVRRGDLTASKIHLVRISKNEVEILHAPTASDIGWVLVILLAMSIIGLLIAVYLHISSRDFAKKELVPLTIWTVKMLKERPSQPNYYMPPYPQHSPPESVTEEVIEAELIDEDVTEK